MRFALKKYHPEYPFTGDVKKALICHNQGGDERVQAAFPSMAVLFP
jgi:hypothetical protein